MNPTDHSLRQRTPKQRRKQSLGAPLLQGRPVRVGHAATYPFAYEMCGKGGTNRHDPCRLPNGAMPPRSVSDSSRHRRFGEIGPGPSHITHSMKLLWPALSRRLLGPATKWARRRVCTMCTPWASDRVVLAPDWAGLGGFRGSGGYSRAGTRFESHLGHVFSLFRGLWVSECAQTVHLWAPSGAFFVGGRCCGRVAPSLGWGQRCCCVLLHGRGRWNCLTCGFRQDFVYVLSVSPVSSAHPCWIPLPSSKLKVVDARPAMVCVRR